MRHLGVEAAALLGLLERLVGQGKVTLVVEVDEDHLGDEHHKQRHRCAPVHLEELGAVGDLWILHHEEEQHEGDDRGLQVVGEGDADVLALVVLGRHVAQLVDQEVREDEQQAMHRDEQCEVHPHILRRRALAVALGRAAIRVSRDDAHLVVEGGVDLKQQHDDEVERHGDKHVHEHLVERHGSLPDLPVEEDLLDPPQLREE
mmetsp:Transcript_12279/g.25952  ORF Transcript_12279/g.25952 Transcript_12279/m.25952 type:complete len:203 (+) Transcript_12279:804-1412(+)